MWKCHMNYCHHKIAVNIQVTSYMDDRDNEMIFLLFVHDAFAVFYSSIHYSNAVCNGAK